MSDCKCRCFQCKLGWHKFCNRERTCIEVRKLNQINERKKKAE